MKGSDLMTTQVVSVGPETGIDEILAILLERRISGVPVVDAGRVIGSVGEGELLHRHEIGTQDSSAPPPDPADGVRRPGAATGPARRRSGADGRRTSCGVIGAGRARAMPTDAVRSRSRVNALARIADFVAAAPSCV